MILRMTAVPLLVAGAMIVFIGYWSKPQPPPTAMHRISVQPVAVFEYVSVGAISGMDWITVSHLGAILKMRGIPSLIGGSVLYGIQVPTDKVEEAKHIVREESAKRRFFLMQDGKTYDVPESVWSDSVINKPVRQLLRVTDARIPAPVLDVIEQSASGKYRYLTRVHLRKREYFGERGQILTGYEGDIELAVSLLPQSDGMRKSFQILGEGKDQVLDRGGSEWSYH